MQAPDSGYSWVVVVCCAYMHFALFGIFRSAGVMYVAMLHTYDVTREEASWPFSLAGGIFQLTGPLTSLLTHYMSQRKACILGSIIATIGMASCYFAENVTWIKIFYGVVHGVGFGILATLITVTLNQYFVKYRATAIGIAFSGGSISSLVFPVVMEWLLENYDLRDSFLLLSGVVLNTLVAASLMRAPPWIINSKPEQKYLENNGEARDSGVSLDQNAEAKLRSTVIVDLYKTSPQTEPEEEIEDQDDIQAALKEPFLSENKPSNNHDKERCLKNTETVCSNDDSVLFGGSYSKLNTISDTNGNSKQDNFQTNKLEVKEPLMCDNKAAIIVPKKEIVKRSKNPKRDSGLRHSLSSILKQFIFYKLAFTMCIYFLGVHMTFMVIVDFAKDKGIPEDLGVYIISMFSLTDLIGRAGLGWVTDRNFITRRNMISLNLAVLGVLYQLYPLVNLLPGILVIAAVQGLAVGCSITLFFVIQVESMGLKNLTLVVGLTSFINGIATFLRPGIIGLFRDVIGSYDWMFHSIGAVTLIFALMWFIDSYKTRKVTGFNESV